MRKKKEEKLKPKDKKLPPKKEVHLRKGRRKTYVKALFATFIFYSVLFIAGFFINSHLNQFKTNLISKNVAPKKINKEIASAVKEQKKIGSSSANLTPTQTPTNIVKSAEAQTSSSYCLYTPVLMYHHVEPYNLAKQEGHAQLTVDAGIFDQQMKYLADRGYTFYTAEDLANAIISHQPLAGKPIVITLDDGYSDVYQYAFQTAKKYNVKLSLFIPTGLINNPEYLRRNANPSLDHKKDLSYASVKTFNLLVGSYLGRYIKGHSKRG